MRGVGRHLSFVQAAIERVKASIPPDPMEGMTPRARACVEEYLKRTTPEQQYLDLMHGQHPLDRGCEDSGTLDELTERYQKVAQTMPFKLKGFNNDQLLS